MRARRRSNPARRVVLVLMWWSDDRLMSGERAPDGPVVVPVHGLTVRRATDVLAFSDGRLVKAIRYIREHFRESITAADVVRFSGVSRHVLQKVFREHIGHPILNVIMQSRVDEAKRMLLKTDCKVDVVAERCGFTNRLHFHRTLSRLAGLPPAHWRQNHRA